jgi:N-acetylglucosaminyl-diphospho-decaprenol L-rhamnosyltransferase
MGILLSKITVSIVSHGHGSLLYQLLNDIKKVCDNDIDVYLTINVPEKLPFEKQEFLFISGIMHNKVAKGFGANHNAAFLRAKGEYFCVLNPDVRFVNNPFPLLLCVIEKTPEIGVIAPLISNSESHIEVTARKFPTPFSLLQKLFFKKRGHDYSYQEGTLFPDWIAGMFMLFPRDSYSLVEGFDERYFLYYEDVDICTRLFLADKSIAMVTNAEVIHNAQRDSHKKFKFFMWHVSSICRYFCSMQYLSKFLIKRISCFMGCRSQEKM